jgi:hypothetical protein
MKSRIVSRNTETLLYKAYIRPILIYGAETWVLTKDEDEHRLSIFERKILRRFYGPVMDRGRWRVRTNQELYQLFGENDIVKFWNWSRLRWAGHFIAMMTMIYPRESSLASHEESDPEGDPGCVG